MRKITIIFLLLLMAIASWEKADQGWAQQMQQSPATGSDIPENLPSSPPPFSGPDSSSNPGDDQNQEGTTHNADESQRREQPPEPDEDTAELVAPSVPMTLGNARINLPTVVQTYIAQHSPGGVWIIRDKAGKVWRLKLEKALENTTRKVGARLYAAHFLLRTDRAPVHHLDIDFTVDFPEAAWRVKAYRIYKIDGKLRSLPPSQGKKRKAA